MGDDEVIRRTVRPCRHPGCSWLVDSASGYCPGHEDAEARRRDEWMSIGLDFEILRGEGGSGGYLNEDMKA